MRKLGPCGHPTSRTFRRGKATVVLCHQCSRIEASGPDAQARELLEDYYRGNSYKTITLNPAKPWTLLSG